MKRSKNHRPSAFGEYLSGLRRTAGLSLDQTTAAARRRKSGKLSKSALSLYERGEIKSASPELLRSLAEIYNVPFVELAERWFQDRFFSRSESESGFTLPGSPPGETPAKLVLPSEHMKLQSKLESGSEVAVCAMSFNEDRFFDLVLGNIKRGVRYHHLVPEEYRSEYRAFVARIETADPMLSGEVDRQRIFFSPRTELDFPISYVLYLHKNKLVEGFIALPLGRAAYCYQRASEALSWRLYLSFHWSLALSKEQAIRKALSGLYFDVREKIRREESPWLIG